MATVEVPGGADAVVGFEALVEGRYTVMITKCELIPKKSDPSKMTVSVAADVVDEENAGRKVWWYLPISKAGAGITKACLEAAGVVYETTETGALVFDTDDLIGMELDVELGVETYKGKEKNTVKTYLPLAQ